MKKIIWILILTFVILLYPSIYALEVSFVEPTLISGTTTNKTDVEINVSIEDVSLTNLIYNWDGINYSFYDSSLVLMFNFDNVANLGEGNLWNNKVKDLSIYNNDGVLGNTTGEQVPIWTSDGKNNGAFIFETLDFNSNGDSILIKNSDSLNPYGNDFAMMFWFKCDNILDSDISRKGCTETHGGGGWYKMEIGGYGTSNLLSLQFNTAGTDDATLEYNQPVCDNQWHFAIGQRRGNIAELYLDGGKITTFTSQNDATLSGTISNSANLTIGSKDTQNDDFFNGNLDEFRIYIKSFNENEINQIYKSNLYKYDLNKWLFYINQNNLDTKEYTYFVYAKNNLGNENLTETRSINIAVICGDGYCDGSIGENCNSCAIDCLSGNYAICGDGICHGINYGETGNTCIFDCPLEQISAGTCSACFKGKCDGSCNPARETSRCYDCNPGIINICGDLSCTGNENIFNCAIDCGGNVPPLNSCCGDNNCRGNENTINCKYDCGCSIAEKCEDSNECTLDICSILGICENNPVTDNTLCSSGLCCNGNCRTSSCSSDLDCNDGNSCTTDSCSNAGTCSALCSNIQPICGLADGCCGVSCSYLNDPDCKSCSTCFKGKCDNTCQITKETSSCPDCSA